MFPNLLFLMWQLCILKQNNCGLNFENLPTINFVVFTMKTKKKPSHCLHQSFSFGRVSVSFLSYKVIYF